VLKERGNSKDDRKVSGSSLTGVPLHVLHRDNGFNFEVYVNGRLMTRGSQNRNPQDMEAIQKEFEADHTRVRLAADSTHNVFRWGIYMQGKYHIDVDDTVVMWSGIKIDSDARLAPPTCEWTSAGFSLPHPIPSLGNNFTSKFSMTLQTQNVVSYRSNIFWLGGATQRVLAAWLVGNTDDTTKLHVEWGANEGDTVAAAAGGRGQFCVSKSHIAVDQKIEVLIRFDLSSGVEVFINGKSECTAPHPGAAFGAIRNANPLYLSVPNEETADVCLSPISWEEREMYVAPPDPKCCNGVSDGGRACCLKSCGSCGHDGCNKREGGYDGCCGGGVKALGISCDIGPPPCMMTDKWTEGQCAVPNATTPSPPTAATTGCFKSSAGSDPMCCGGVSDSKTCCLKSCGTCGNTGCSSRAGGHAGCCIGGVKGFNGGVSCDDGPPPCIMSKSRRDFLFGARSSNTYCTGGTGKYTSLSEAQTACTLSSSCTGVYSKGCDGDETNPWKLTTCTESTYAFSKGGSCVYKKAGPTIGCDAMGMTTPGTYPVQAKGCDGVELSGKSNDSCGVCGGDDSLCKGCDGIPNSGQTTGA
jgi:hypothetical protein